MKTPDPTDTPNPQIDELWERAVTARLSKLRSMPVDTSRLAQAVRAQIPQSKVKRLLLLRRFGALAASFLVVGAFVAVLVLSTSGGPVLASAGQMARLHEDLVSGKTPSVQVESIEAANRVLSERWPQSPQVPQVSEMPQDHVMACCMRSVKDKKVACVLMKREGVAVSLVVAHGRDMHTPDSPVTERNGVRYHTQSSGKLNMVTTEREGRWICLISELPAERLMDVAERLRF